MGAGNRSNPSTMPLPPQSAPGPSADPVAAATALDVLVLIAHPEMEHSRTNRRMAERAAAVAAASGGRIVVRDLYALYPDYWIDAAAEQTLLASARLVVWQHPIQWYQMPPLMRLWCDEVLAFGWAYGPGGTALHGKDLWLAATLGGAEDYYRPGTHDRHFLAAFLPPYEQIAALCGMRFLPPLLLHGAHRADAEAIEAHSAAYERRLRSYPAWPELAERPPVTAWETAGRTDASASKAEND